MTREIINNDAIAHAQQFTQSCIDTLRIEIERVYDHTCEIITPTRAQITMMNNAQHAIALLSRNVDDVINATTPAQHRLIARTVRTMNNEQIQNAFDEYVELFN